MNCHQWPIAGGPLVVRHCMLGGLVTFLSAKTYDLRAKKNNLHEGPTLDLIVFTQLENCVLGIQKKWLDETVLLSTQNTSP